MKFAFQMDPIETLNFSSDSSWQLMLEAARRGEVYYFTPKNLFWLNGEILADIQKVEIKDNNYSLGEVKRINLVEMDVIFIRQDPPYDMAYLTTTYLLEKISDQTLIINSPKAIRDFPEKISVLDYLDFIPPTLITYSETRAKEFAKNHDKVILKPLYSFAGSDVFCVTVNDKDFSKIMGKLIKAYQTPVIVQKFIEGITEGDKRIILVNGDPVGCYLRLPKSGDIIANTACGGKAVPSELTAQDIKICTAIKSKLVENGLFLAGIDVIAGYLTEINITSPTGITILQKFYDSKITEEIFNRIEKRLSIN